VWWMGRPVVCLCPNGNGCAPPSSLITPLYAQGDKGKQPMREPESDDADLRLAIEHSIVDRHRYRPSDADDEAGPSGMGHSPFMYWHAHPFVNVCTSRRGLGKRLMYIHSYALSKSNKLPPAQARAEDPRAAPALAMRSL
jgi:hypothetical protein